MVEVDVAEIAAEIATRIRTNGHYQGKSTNMPGQSCIFYNSGMPVMDSMRLSVMEAIAKAARMKLPADRDARGYADSYEAALAGKLIGWNDRSSTERVLTVLDKVATSKKSEDVDA